MVLHRCSECGKSLKRYTFATLKKGLRITGGYHTHQCPSCGTYYAPSPVAAVLIILILNFIEFPEMPFEVNTWWGIAIFIIFIFMPLLYLVLMYVFPLSVFWKIRRYDKK